MSAFLAGPLSADPEAFKKNKAESFARFKDAFEKLYPTDDHDEDRLALKMQRQPSPEDLAKHGIVVRDFAYQPHANSTTTATASTADSVEGDAVRSSSPFRPGRKRRSEDFDFLSRDKSRLRLS